MVYLVEIDVVNAESAKTPLYGGLDVLRRRSSCIRVDTGWKANLRRDHDLVSLRPQQGPEYLLGGATAVHVGGIKEVAPGITKHLDDPPGLRAIAAPPGHTEIHGTQADLRNFQPRASERPVVHAPPLQSSGVIG